MSPPMIGGLGILALLVLLLMRVPVWTSMMLVGGIGNLLVAGPSATMLFVGTTPFDVSSSYTLSVLPLFVLMGDVATNSRLSAELFKAARIFMSGFRGGLSLATIGASACFGAVCGSSIATAATITRIALPEMRRAGYHDSLATGSIAAGGSLGILIPPSIILVIYAAISEQSVPKLFAAGLIPGIVLTVLYSLIALAVVLVVPEYAPTEPSLPMRQRFAALAGPWQFMTLFVVTIGGIYMGIFSPTEAAAIGALGVIVLGFLGRRLSVRDLIRSLESTVLTSCMLFMIIIAATLFSVFVVQTHLPEVLAETALAMNMPGTLVMTLIVVTYILMGCVLEGIGMMLITVPVFLPLVVHYGYDPVWFGVIVVIVVEVGLMNPPVGMNLFVIQAQAPDVRLRNIYLGILPFLIAPVILIGLLFLFPQIALWFPTWLYG